MKTVTYFPIGVIRSPFKDISGMPIQPTGALGVEGSIELEPEYLPGLRDLEGFSHIILLYHFHLSRGYELEVKPFLDDQRRGLFATRAPKRPNSIGFSVVKLVEKKGNILYIKDVDVVDGTPLLDIKPYVPKFDVRETERTGWLSRNAHQVEKIRADERFK